jgi:hypothetical protein
MEFTTDKGNVTIGTPAEKALEILWRLVSSMRYSYYGPE